MKKGFTLIELLAVIIILAVVALVATPIVLNVVEDAKESARESKLKLYADNVKLKASEDYFAKGGVIDGEIDTTTINDASTSCEKAYYTNGSVYLSNCTVDGDTVAYYANGETTDEKPANWDTLIAGLGTSYTVESIFAKILTKYPYLALANTVEKGCATPGDNNYTYMGGCYLKGLPTENYVWFNGFMYRIMGINADGSIKMITEENVTSIPWGANNTGLDYTNSYVKKWLNEDFLTNTNTTLNNNIVNGNFCFGTATTESSSSNITCTGTIFNDKVGLISIDEQNLAGLGSSYLNSAQSFWTLTPYSAFYTWYVNNDGSVHYNGAIYSFGVRPVINVKPTTTITAGNGTINDYFVLGETKEATSGALLTNAKVGEYVTYANKIYRVVKNTETGTKLILDGYYNQDLVYGTREQRYQHVNCVQTLMY